MKVIELRIKPDENEPEAAEVLVEGKIDNRDYCFLLDTGAARTTLVPDDYIGQLEVLNQSIGHGVFSSGEEELIKVSKIEIGPIYKDSATVKRLKHNFIGARNIVGMDVLKEYSYAFYFNKNKAVIDPGIGVVNGQELVLGKNHHPYVEVFFGGIQAKAVWDTGAGITVVDLTFIKENPEFFEELEMSKGTDSTGATQESPMFLMKSPKLANLELPPHKVAGVDLSHVNKTTEIPMDMILGYSTLSKANWFFDFPKREWAILNLI